MLLVPLFASARPEADTTYDGYQHLAAQGGRIRGAYNRSIRGRERAATLLLDQYPDAHGAYSLRKLSSVYNGPAVRVRRGSDDVEADVDFDANEQVSMSSPISNASDAGSYSSLADFAGTDTCFVVTWFDQTGGSADLTLLASPDGQAYNPRLVDGGSLVVNDNNLPAILWESSGDLQNGLLYTSGMPSLSNIDQTAFLVFLKGNGVHENILYNANPIDTWGQDHLQFRVKNSLTVRLGGRGKVLNDSPRSISAAYILDSDPTNFRLFINRTQADPDWAHGASNNTSMGITLGGETKTAQHGFTGFVSEVVVYPHLSNADRTTIFEDYINSFWQLAPGTINPQALFPQDFQYQVDLYDWLETLTLADVTLPVGATVTWDGTRANADELSRLWAETLWDGDNRRGFSKVTASEPKWYVLDDGNGYGIEGYGWAQGDSLVRTPAERDASGGSHARASEAAWWYQWDVPLAGGGQGNPLYQHPGVGNRALVLAAVDLMMLDHAIYTGVATISWGDRTDFIGGYLISIADAYRSGKDLLDSQTKAAFEAGMLRLVNRMLVLGAKDVNSNMDGKAVEGCAITYVAAPTNIELRDACVRVAREVLFGYEDGSLAKIDSDAGIFYLEGLVREADGPATTYNGRSIAHIAAARAHTYDDPSWGFLDDVLPRMCDFMFHQHYHQPGPVAFTLTPDGYSNRTAGGMRELQDTPWGRLTMAFLYQECRPFVWGWKWMRPLVLRQSELQSETQRRMGEIGSVPEYTDMPKTWAVKEPWPTILPYTPPVSGWHATLRGYVDNGQYYHVNHPLLSATFSRTFPAAVEAGNDWQTGEQWWARRADTSPDQFAYFIEATRFSGTFGGYFSGKVEAFWREGQGAVILNRREPKGRAYGWANVDKWRVEHAWGYDENGGAFSWATVNGDKDPGNAAYRTVTWDEQLQALTVVTPMENRGEETGSEIIGSVTQTKTFVALSNGLEVTTQIDSDESDSITELWLTLPVYEGGQGDPDSMPANLAIEYWTGSSWAVLSSTLATTEKVRVGHDWGSGFVYTYISFDTSQSVRLMPADTNLDFQRIHLLQIDLHGNPGTVITLPGSTSVTYAITTTDTSSPPPPNHAPAITLTDPSDGATFPAPANITFTADASDSDGRVTKVEFFEGSTKLGEGTTAPYSLVWQGVPAGSYTLTAVATDNDGATTTSRAVNITVEPPPSSQQSVDLAQGWNLVSTHIAPPDPSLEVVLADILPDLVMVRDADGGFYDPSTATNTIGDWEPLEAYMVNVQAPVVLTFEGDQILPDTTSIPLNAGWNLVPYLRDESLPVDVALASIAPHLVLVKDENGQIYYPGYGINTIGDLQPGQGYKIYVDQATTLTFPANNVNRTRTRRSPASGVNQARTLGSPANK